MNVEIEFDSQKDAINRAKHGFSLHLAALLFAALLFAGDYKEKLDEREDYGELRMIAIGPIAGRLCVCVYTWRNGVRRIISLRRANKGEIDAYHQS